MRWAILAALLCSTFVAGCRGTSWQQQSGPEWRSGSLASPELVALGMVGGKSVSGAPQGIFVRWTRSVAPEAQGYYLYRDTQSIPDPPLDGTIDPSLRVNSGNQISQPASGTFVTFNDLFSVVVGQTYYYRVTVVDNFGDESYPSNEMSWMVHGQSVTGLNPTSAFWGDTITLTGDTFGTYDPATDHVMFFGATGLMVEGAVLTWADTQITATVPMPAKTAPVYVVIDGTIAATDEDLVILNPYITGITPEIGFVQQPMILSGRNFGATQGASTVTIGGVDASSGVTSWNDGNIQLTIPAGVVQSDVVVSVGSQSSNGVLFTPRPEILGVSDEPVEAGEPLTITGRYFGAAQGTVQLGGNSLSVSSWADTSITVTVAGSAAIYNLQLSDAGGIGSNVRPFEVEAGLSATIGGLDQQTLYEPSAPPDMTITAPSDIDSYTLYVDGAPLTPTVAGAAPVSVPLPVQYIHNGLHSIQLRVDRRSVNVLSNAIPVYVFSLPGDIDGDGVVGDADQDALAPLIGLTNTDFGYYAWFDTDGDGVVTEADLALVGYNFGNSVPLP